MNLNQNRSGWNPAVLCGDLWRHRDLISQLTVRTVAQEVKGSYLGVLWTLFTPLLMLAVYSVVFGMIFGARFDESPGSGPVDYVLGLFLGLTLYGMVADMLGSAPRVILNNPNYVKKVVFPLEALPASVAGAALYRFAVTMVLVLAGVLLLGNGLTWQALWFPLTLMPVVLMALGLAYLLSALGVYYRDISQVTGVLSMVLLYASGVFYAAEKVRLGAPGIWSWLQFNPVLLSIDSSRRVLLWGSSPDAWHLGWAWLCGLALCLGGYAVFRRLRYGFADIL